MRKWTEGKRSIWKREKENAAREYFLENYFYFSCDIIRCFPHTHIYFLLFLHIFRCLFSLYILRKNKWKCHERCSQCCCQEVYIRMKDMCMNNEAMCVCLCVVWEIKENSTATTRCIIIRMNIIENFADDLTFFSFSLLHNMRYWLLALFMYALYSLFACSSCQTCRKQLRPSMSLFILHNIRLTWLCDLFPCICI